MNKQRNLTTVWIAIAFILACKELSRHTGVAASDWGKELRRRAFDKLVTWSDAKIATFIAENINY